MATRKRKKVEDNAFIDAAVDAARAEAALPPVWERGMNPEQLAVIAHQDGPLCNFAVAGAGKTRALVHRIARMVATGTAPQAILAVTFSKKAADEMNVRLQDLGVGDCRVGTWHSLCLQVLREDETPWSSWRIDDEDRAKVILKEALGYKHLDWKQADTTKVRQAIGVCKANLAEPMGPEAEAVMRARFSGSEVQMAMRAYDIFQKLVEERGLLTFDDMMLFVYRHFTTDDANRARWASKWNYLLVDECQDNNLAQKTIQEMLAREHRNIMLVGDPAQAIYSFRGSTPEYLMAFAGEWAGTKTVVMNRNYRSGAAIIRAANAVIKPGKARLDVDMIAERGVEGSVRAVCSPTLDEEGAAFAAWAREHHDEGGSWGDVTCLFRTNAQSRALEEALLSEKIPYVVVGGTSFYERKEVKDLLGYLRVATGSDRSDAVKRCVNAPFRYLGLAFVEKLMTAAQGGVRSWPGLVREVAQRAGIQARQRASAEEWAGLVEDLQLRVAQGARPAELLNDLVHRTRYLDYLRKEEGEESVETSQQSNVRELCRVAERFATAAELLAYIEENLAASRRQRQDRQAGGDRVLLMSVHRSKGLEWPLVWVAGCNEMVLPHARGDEDEERRLMYVAITRARDSLVLSYVRSFATSEGVRDAQPSRFLRDAGLLPAPADETRVSLAGRAEVLATGGQTS